jgi:hypothetical protein
MPHWMVYSLHSDLMQQKGDTYTATLCDPGETGLEQVRFQFPPGLLHMDRTKPKRRLTWQDGVLQPFSTSEMIEWHWGELFFLKKLSDFRQTFQAFLKHIVSYRRICIATHDEFLAWLLSSGIQSWWFIEPWHLKRYMRAHKPCSWPGFSDGRDGSYMSGAFDIIPCYNWWRQE